MLNFNPIYFRFLIAIIITSSASLSSGQTVVSPGSVSGTWTKSGSPYRVDGDLIIPKDSILTIEPGVVVSFIDKYGIKVDGSIHAKGTANDRIVFKPENLTDKWKGMLFLENPDTSVFMNCNIEHCEDGILYDSNGQKVRLNGSDVLYSAIGAYNSAYLTIDNCIFNSNLRSVSLEGTSARISESLFENHGDSGATHEVAVYVDSSFATIKNCEFKNNISTSGYLVRLGQAKWQDINKTTYLLNCEFENNVQCNLVIEGEHVRVENCSFLNNSHTYGGAMSGTFRGQISNCLFQGNKSTIYGHAIQLVGNCDGAFIERCRFLNNGDSRTGKNAAILYREGQGTVTVLASTFEGNTGGVEGLDSTSGFLIVSCDFYKNMNPVNLAGQSVIINSNITHNRSYLQQSSGEEIEHYSGLSLGGEAHIYNSIFWGNNDSANNSTQVLLEDSSVRAHFYHCIMEGDSAGFQKGDSNDFIYKGDYVNCISQMPEWMDTARSWLLKNECHAYAYRYNKGYIGSALDPYMDYLNFDITSNYRWVFDTLDIGAYEIGTFFARFFVLQEPEDDEVCLGSDGRFYFILQGNEVDYEWQYSTDQGANWSYAGKDNPLTISNASLADNGKWYRVNMANQCGQKGVYGPAKLSVHDRPTVDLGPDFTMPDDSVAVLNGPTGWTSYLWSDNSTDDSLVIDGQTLGVGDHTFWLEVMNQFSCRGRDTVEVEITKAGLAESVMIQKIFLQPNPASDLVEFPAKFKKVQIVNASGRLVSAPIQVNKGLLDVSDLASGIYWLLLTTDDGENGVGKLVRE